MCGIGVKYQYEIRAVFAYARVFRKCALIGACALIRTNTVLFLHISRMLLSQHIQKHTFNFDQSDAKISVFIKGQ